MLLSSLSQTDSDGYYGSIPQRLLDDMAEEMKLLHDGSVDLVSNHACKSLCKHKFVVVKKILKDEKMIQVFLAFLCRSYTPVD